jgi:hypothetical protein
MPQRHLPASIFVLLALTFAGCGSSTSTSAQSHKPTALVAKADLFCKAVAEKRAAANAALVHVSTSTAKTLEVLAQIAPGIASYEQDLVRALESLKPSGSEGRDLQTLTAGIQALANDTAQLAVEAKAKNIAGVRRIDASGRKTRAALKAIAVRDGFSYCGIDS